MTTRAVSVALPVPLYGTYVYTVEQRHANKVAPGSRVVVSVRNRRVIGVITGVDPELDPKRTYRPILDAPDETPSLTEPLLRTCQWISKYYAALPKAGVTYVIRNVSVGVNWSGEPGEVCLHLIGLVNPRSTTPPCPERGFNAERFRPLDELPPVEGEWREPGVQTGVEEEVCHEG